MTMSAPAPAAPHSLRKALLLGCALAGLAGAAGWANAQAFDALPETKFGAVVYDRATPGVETVQVETPTAVIDWRPNDPLVFLPAGNVATFRNGPNNLDFVVLNRILATTPMRFDGSVLSRIQTIPGGPLVTGGTVIFSSPGGLIIGGGAVFDVGSLVLTTLNVQVDSTGNFYDPATRGLNFDGGELFPDAAIVTEAGAQISALNESSYVAMVAPVIQHGGSVRVNGSAAYIAGEQVQMRVNQGLFDIIVEVGSDNAVPFAHTGTTGGPASTGAGDDHAIYLVAVPKNQAITAVLEGDVGFDPAVSASIENGVIVLSAGYNLLGGAVDRYGGLTGEVPGAGLASTIAVQGGTFTSDVFGYATHVEASGASGGTLTFTQDVSLFGDETAELFAGENETVTVEGDAVVSAARFDDADGAIDLTGGSARIFALQGGTVRIFGNATVDASARGLLDTGNTAGTGTGGTAEVAALGGAILIDGDLQLLATGEGGSNPLGTSNFGAAGQGGEVQLIASNGGSVSVGGATEIDISGIATASEGSSPAPGADGSGGSAFIGAEAGGAIVLGGPVSVVADGRGGGMLANPGVPAGQGSGGAITLSANGGTIGLGAGADFSATGRGGIGPSGGAGSGGEIVFEALGGEIDFGGAAIVAADGLGGDAGILADGDGGQGSGGSVLVIARSGSLASRISGGALDISARGAGGAGLGAGAGGEGTGGSIAVLAGARTGMLAFGAVSAIANGLGGDGPAGGVGGGGFGGEVTAGTIEDGDSGVPAGSATFAGLDLRATGTGGAGGASGAGAGGDVALSSDGAPVTVTGAALLEADGVAVAGGAGGDGTASGGRILISTSEDLITGTPGALVLGDVAGSASAIGNAPAGNLAGEWRVAALGGNITAANIALGAAAPGAPGADPVSSIAALGGTITVTQNGSFATDGGIAVNVEGTSRLVGGGIALLAGGDVVVTHANPGAGPTIDVAELDVEAENVVLAAGSLTRAADQADIIARGDVTVDGRLEAREIAIDTAGIAVAATGAVGTADTEVVDIVATGDAAIAGTVLGDAILIDAANIDLAASGAVGSATTATVALTATGDASLAGTVLGDDIQVDAADIAVSGVVGDAATSRVGLAAAAGATVSGAVLGNLINVSGTDVTVAAGGTVGGAGTDTAVLDALGDAVIAGAVRGTGIEITSADIDIQASGTVGDAATQDVALNVRDTGEQTVIGGTADGPGYTLTEAEAQRIRADRLAIGVTLATPAPAGPPDLVIRDLALDGGGAATGVRVLAVETNGIMRVEGALALGNAGATSRIDLLAGQRLEVSTPAGSIRLRDAGGAPAGTLQLASDNIWVASAGIIEALRADPDYPGRDDDLLDNGGTQAPLGYIEGDAVTLVSGGTLYVQNSGSSQPFTQDYAGITVGPGGLTITAAAPGTNVTAFGRRLNADGSFTTGDAFFFQSTYNVGGSVPGSFTTGAALNTCIIVTGLCPARAPDNPEAGGRDPITGPLAIPLAGADGDDLVDTSFAADPLVEEPVTSGSETILWGCDPENEGGCDAQPR